MTDKLVSDVMDEIHFQPYIYEDLKNSIIDGVIVYLENNMDDMFGDVGFYVENGRSGNEAVLDFQSVGYTLDENIHDEYFDVSCFCKYDVVSEGFDEHDFTITYTFDYYSSENYEFGKVPPVSEIENEDVDIMRALENMTADIEARLPAFVKAGNKALGILNAVVQGNVSANMDAEKIVGMVIRSIGINSVDDLYE